MDFFAAQDLARRNSRRLVGWFVLAVIGVIGSVYLAAIVIFGLGTTEGSYDTAAIELWNPEVLITTALAVGGFILLGSLFKIFNLARGGGAAVAAELGGRLVPRASTDPLERRLINVVDEMAIAAGIPSPPVYVLDAEHGINAFAAGARPSEGVVAVTRGSLEQLSRDELQGVIGHEFSHILNGDMGLNLRLIGVLHGILLLTLAGRVLLRSARGSDKGGAPLLAMGLVLIVIGSVGVLFGKLIKAGVSRQREYLADAAAIQFTRNPTGLVGALKKIGGIGSNIQHPRAEEASHMLFSTGAKMASLFATHPPLETRIKRIDADFDPSMMQAATPRAGPSSTNRAPPAVATFDNLTVSGFSASVGDFAPAHVAHTHTLIEALPASLIDAIHQPGGAAAVLFALLLSEQEVHRANQLERVEADFGRSTREASHAHAEWLWQAGPRYRLPVTDLSLPALKELSAPARQQILSTIDALIESDDRTSLFEYVLRRLVHDGLADRGAIRPAMVSLSSLKSDSAALLALLARAGHGDADDTRAAFTAATLVAPLDPPWEMPDTRKLGTKALDRILGHLAACKPAFRKKMVEACATVVLHDGKVTVAEAELLRAVSKALDCPVPPLLRYAN